MQKLDTLILFIIFVYFFDISEARRGFPIFIEGFGDFLCRFFVSPVGEYKRVCDGAKRNRLPYLKIVYIQLKKSYVCPNFLPFLASKLTATGSSNFAPRQKLVFSDMGDKIFV